MARVLTFTPQRSSHIERLSYDPDTERLKIRFTNKSTYTFAGVPSDVFAKMTRAESQGEYFHKVIQRFYPMIEKKGGKSANAESDADAEDQA